MGNIHGQCFRIATFGESHGPAIGCIVDGCPPGLTLTVEDIQMFLDKRRPGQSRFTTQRQEPDAVRILSGVFEDDRTGGPVTTGTPIMLLIENTDQRSKDYAEIRDNTISAQMLPIDLLRAKLAFFGALHFDPRSDRWLRINMFKGAPFPQDLAGGEADDWTYPPLREVGL